MKTLDPTRRKPEPALFKHQHIAMSGVKVVAKNSPFRNIPTGTENSIYSNNTPIAKKQPQYISVAKEHPQCISVAKEHPRCISVAKKQPQAISAAKESISIAKEHPQCISVAKEHPQCISVAKQPQAISAAKESISIAKEHLQAVSAAKEGTLASKKLPQGMPAKVHPQNALVAKSILETPRNEQNIPLFSGLPLKRATHSTIFESDAYDSDNIPRSSRLLRRKKSGDLFATKWCRPQRKTEPWIPLDSEMLPTSSTPSGDKATQQQHEDIIEASCPGTNSSDPVQVSNDVYYLYMHVVFINDL